MPSLVLQALPLGGTYVPIGTSARRGIYVEDFQCSSDFWGSLDASFLLKRTYKVRWPDIDAWGNLEAYADNQLAWSGRVIATPGSDDSGEQIQVNAQGWQSHADDRPFSKFYAQNSLSAWSDVRQNVNADLTNLTGARGIVGDGTGITITLKQGDTRPANSKSGVYIDLGPASVAQRIVISWSHSNNAPSETLILVAANSVATLTTMGALANVVALGATPTGTQAYNLAGFRYIGLFLADNSGSTVTAGADTWIKLTSVQIFGNAAYESGNTSILKASDIVTEALGRLTAINSSTGYIDATSFSINAFSADQQTPRDVINAANGFQDWQASVLPMSPDGAAVPTLRYRAKPTTPMYALTDKGSFQDASTGTIDLVYNEVTYKGNDPTGAPILVTRTTSAAGLPACIPDRRGVTKGFTIESSAPLSATAAQQLCDVFLAQHNTMPFKGSVNATNRRAVQITPSGVNVPPWMLLSGPGELMSFRQLKNPDTGALGREGRIAKTTYTHASDSAALDIDSTAGSFDALNARLAANQPTAR